MIAHAAAELTRFEVESLERIRETMLSGLNHERALINRLAKDAEGEQLEDLGSDNHFLDEAEELVGKLLLVGLYRVVENSSKQALRHRYSENKVKKCYKIDQLKKVFADDLKADLTKVKNFAKIDELRDHNNTVKHGGKLPAKALAMYEHYRDYVYQYIHDLVLAVVPDTK
ncbi:MAG: hypothetical protein K8U57_35980 [Planctomycetes bacterium]|nr:hypothetical protein [Planctomycetota bacterium]